MGLQGKGARPVGPLPSPGGPGSHTRTWHSTLPAGPQSGRPSTKTPWLSLEPGYRPSWEEAAGDTGTGIDECECVCM